MSHARLLLAGGAAVIAARLLIPAAPPIYEGATFTIPPYNYVSPPPDLRSSNTAPPGGSKTFPVKNGVSTFGTALTADNQVVIYFNQGVLVSPGATSIKVDIVPATDPPPPPRGSRMVGNDYRITALGEPGDLPVTLNGSAQALFRVPPVIFSSVRLYHDNDWHELTLTVQTQEVNIAFDHLGDLAAFNDPGRRAHNPAGGSDWLKILDAVVVAAALAVIAAAIVRGRTRRG